MKRLEQFRMPDGPLEPMIPRKGWACGCYDAEVVEDDIGILQTSSFVCGTPDCGRRQEPQS